MTGAVRRLAKLEKARGVRPLSALSDAELEARIDALALSLGYDDTPGAWRAEPFWGGLDRLGRQVRESIHAAA